MTSFSETAAIQTDYLPTPDFPEFGARWRARQASDIYDSACGDMRVNTPGVLLIEVTSNTNAETWHFNYDGVVVPFTTGASVAATVASLNTALASVFGTGKVLESHVTSIVAESPNVTITFAPGVVPASTPTITASAGGLTSTFGVVYSTEPTAAKDHEPGLWVAVDTTRYDPQLTSVKEPSSLSDRPYGIVMLEGALSKTNSDAVGPVLAHWPAGRAMSVARHFEGGIIGRADGEITAADVGAPVYMVVSGVRKGWSRKNSGGTSQVTTGTVVPTNGDSVGLTIDALPSVSITSTADGAATAALLAAAVNGRADLAAIVTATTDNNDIVLTFKDFATHTVVAVSPATADVTPISSTTPVAASAVLTKSTFMQPAADGAGVAIAVLEG